ncbi:MAG: efflux RND transporter periplasmic adaptor subunit [Proteobacteria bacterium]|nr:efflux RND transporter periplasmic adaptor subunit [Pseudomonadota bacterium]
MIKRMIIMLLAAGLVFGGVFWFKIFQAGMTKKYMSAMGAPPQTVSTITAESTEWQKRFEAVGSLRAAKGVDLSSETPGIVAQINFESGDDIKAGETVVQLNAEDDIAKLAALQAAANLAKTTYDRDSKQFKVQAISQETLDTDEANLKSADAQVTEQQAIVEKKSIKAPFDGHLGIRMIDLGQYLNPGTPVVTLQALGQLYLDFFLPQQALAQIQSGQKITVKNDTWPDRIFNGEITTINPKVETSTRNIQVRATLDNTDRALLPGMYATVSIDIGAPQNHVTLPQTSIIYNPYGNTVYLVDDTAKDEKGQPKIVAKQTFVTVGDTRGDQVAIMSGVKEGDVVVTSGQLKLRNGAPLAINNKVTPTNQPNPTPAEQ